MTSAKQTWRSWKNPTYNSWRGMLDRCRNPHTAMYKNYGGRGITVCARWLRYDNFLADMGERPMGHSLDRIDNDGNYDPTNCRWATSREQATNQRRRLVARDGHVPQCRRGHAYTPDNTFTRKSGYRDCKTCRRELQRRRAHGRVRPDSVADSKRTESDDAG